MVVAMFPEVLDRSTNVPYFPALPNNCMDMDVLTTTISVVGRGKEEGQRPLMNDFRQDQLSGPHDSALRTTKAFPRTLYIHMQYEVSS